MENSFTFFPNKWIHSFYSNLFRFPPRINLGMMAGLEDDADKIGIPIYLL